MMVAMLGLADWLVVPLLARVQQPATEAANSLPEGNSEVLVSTSCVGCHSLKISLRRGRSREAWVTTVNDIISRGAQILPADTETIVDYLADHYDANFVAPRGAAGFRLGRSPGECGTAGGTTPPLQPADAFTGRRPGGCGHPSGHIGYLDL